MNKCKIKVKNIKHGVITIIIAGIMITIKLHHINNQPNNVSRIYVKLVSAPHRFLRIKQIKYGYCKKYIAHVLHFTKSMQ